MKEIIKTTCPRDCYDSCGIAVIKRDGKVTKVLGDPDHPMSQGALCGKCALAYNGVWRDHSQRLSQPLRRSGPKGSGQFETIDWPSALALIVERLKQEASQDPGRILHAHYTGTCSLLASHFPMRFFNRLGAAEVDPDTVCNAAGHQALSYLYGTSVRGFDPKTLKDSACIMVWGANPSASAPHVHKNWLGRRSCPMVVVDPVRHETADAADLYLQPFPGSDAALAFAILHELRGLGLWDNKFLEDYCHGWQDVLPQVDTATATWGEAQTGVPADDIKEAARLYGAGPAMLWLGQGLQRQPQGGNVFRATGLLPAFTGNIGKPGTGIYFLNGTWAQKIDSDLVERPDLRTAPLLSVSHMELAPHLADPGKVGVFMSWNMNVAASGPRQRELQAALSRDDLFTVVIDLFQTDTADYADIILPAASFLEFDDLVMPYFQLYLSAQTKVEEPPGEALPNQEIFRRLALAMGWEDAVFQESDRDLLDQVLAKSAVDTDFDRLKELGTLDPWSEPRIAFEKLLFRTPSNKIEIASDVASADGQPRVPQATVDQRPKDGRLRLLSPSSKWTMNDSYANDPKVREKLGALTITLHPSDAAFRGLSAGDRVVAVSDVGEIEVLIAIDQVTPEGVALTCKGHWPRMESGRANINAINPGQMTDMGQSSAVHGLEVTLRPA